MDSLMEWYYASDVDDLVVPKDQESVERVPSPDCWSQWGYAAFGSIEYPKKHLVSGTNINWEELNFKGKSFSDEVNISFSGNERAQSSESSMCQGLQSGLLQWTSSPLEQQDYQLHDPTEIDQTSSLLEEDVTGSDYLHGSFGFYSKFQESMMPDDTFLTDMTLESQYNPSHLYGPRSSEYLKTHAFSPPMGWENKEVATYCPPLKAPVVNLSITFEQDNGNEQLGEETSVEESALQELERVKAQLTEKTRLCFRDALYRLAENSKQDKVIHKQDEELLLEKHSQSMSSHETFRLGKREARELRTNAIDRAIANLLFNKMDFSAQHLPPLETTGQCDYGLNQPQIACCSHFIAGDAEVPTCGPENRPSKRLKLHTDFSSSAASLIQSRC
ncbi:unnamed protein product [Ilex paraguariensis]|uniref:Protein LNK3 n=1 Tax=Ilex paraguariensis TaxID=185542 RepID=A0ABC8QQD4_9AQUA